MSFDINDLTFKQIKELRSIFSINEKIENTTSIHPMVGKRCLIRTYSAGVHIGDVCYANGMEILLNNALRLWKWTGGGLSLSSVATNGIKGGRINKTGEIYLTNVIEIITITEKAEKTYEKFIEDNAS